MLSSAATLKQAHALKLHHLLLEVLQKRLGINRGARGFAKPRLVIETKRILHVVRFGDVESRQCEWRHM
jgi:hypothetical protein